MQETNPIQNAILELKKEFHVERNNPNNLVAVQNRLEQQFQQNTKEYGVRENFGKIRQFFHEGKDRKLEKFYAQADMFDPRFQDLEDPRKNYQGRPADQFVKYKDNRKWMKHRNFGDKDFREQDQRDFIKDIFIAIDEDGSGTMDQDELIKALLSLGLSQDIQFAKKIVNVLKENKRQLCEKKLPKYGPAQGDDDSHSCSSNEDLEFTFKDFL